MSYKNMSELYLLFNHTLTLDQEKAACHDLGVAKIVEPPDGIRNIWQQLPPNAQHLYPLLEPVRAWLRDVAEPGSFLLVQGDFGATYLMVCFALEQGLIPVYATTRRRAIEEHLTDGTVKTVHVFHHVRYRKYGS